MNQMQPHGPRDSHPSCTSPQPKIWLHVVLFLITWLSVTTGYATFTAISASQGVLTNFIETLITPARLVLGLPFSIPLMSILLAHEMGHYITARRYGVDQSLPYFIPAPGTFFGTFGALILMRTQPPNRSALLKVAVMGPYMGLILAIPCAAWGLANSVPMTPEALENGGLRFGSSILFGWLETLFSPNGTDIYLHPVGMAGWIGLLITTLNLIPAAQLDGGHVAYALFGKHHQRLTNLVILALLGLGVIHGMNGGMIWVVWAMLLCLFGRSHPPVDDTHCLLTPCDRLNGLIAFALFVLTFTPVPIKEEPATAPELVSTEQFMPPRDQVEEYHEPKQFKL